MSKRHTLQKFISIGQMTGTIKISGDIDKLPRNYIPEGWLKRAQGEWVPQWPLCKYRRLKIFISPRRPLEIIPICFIDLEGTNNCGEEVTHDFCCGCKLAVTPEITYDMIAQEEKAGQVLVSRTLQPVKSDQGETEAPPSSPWEPCVHRESKQTVCCNKFYCKHSKCPLLNQRLKKTDCEGCEFRESPSN